MTVVDADGVSRIILSTNIFAGVGTNYRVGIHGDEYAGIVSTHGKDGKSHAELVTFSRGDGGNVYAVGKDGKSKAELRIDRNGGRVVTTGNDGKSAAQLGIDEDGGQVVTTGTDGKSHAGLGIDKHGGFVQLNGKGQGAVAIGINEYGNGAVSTSDKNGYRQ